MGMIEVEPWNLQWSGLFCSPHFVDSSPDVPSKVVSYTALGMACCFIVFPANGVQKMAIMRL